MYEHQPGLPRMPIPDLEDSCAAFLKALEPLTYADDEVLEEARRAVATFVEPGGDGETLQAELVRRDSGNVSTSYIAPFWNRLVASCWRALHSHSTDTIGMCEACTWKVDGLLVSTATQEESARLDSSRR